MWRKLVSSSHLQTLAPCRRLAPVLNRSGEVATAAASTRSLNSASLASSTPTVKPNPTTLFSHQAMSDSEASLSKGTKKRVQDFMPIATGHEREELDAELEGRNILEMNFPVGPFGTKEVPAVVKSVYDKRIVGCPGGEGEDEHDVMWFWLERGKPHECPVCSQYFKLEVVGHGGSPDGHGDDDHH